MTEELGMDEILAQSVEAKPGSIVDGVVVSQTQTHLLIDVGLKQEALLSLNEFSGEVPQVGQTIPVLFIGTRGSEGKPLVSSKQARERTHWDAIATSFEKGEKISGKIVKRVKGGVQIDIGLDAFLPASQIDERPVHKPEEWIGKTVEVLVLEMNRAKGNVLVSRRKILESEKALKREEVLKTIKIDQVVKGKVTGLTNFGAFIDIGGAEGLLHISDFSWLKNEVPSKVLKTGQEIEVKVLKYDAATKRISLGRKQLLPHPWEGVEKKYPVGSRVKGKVTGFAAFGMFVQVAPGIDGLIHLSEVSWTQKPKSLKEKFKVGQEIEAVIITLDRPQEKMSLSLKRLETNPWEELFKKYPKGSKIDGEVSHLAPFGAFVKVAAGLEALLKTQDLSWTKRIQAPDQMLKVGQKIQAVVLDIDVQKEKMSLGLKQLQPDPLSELKVGKSVTGKVVKLMDFGVFVKLDSGLDGLIRSSELKLDRSMFEERKKADNQAKTEALQAFKEGDSVTATVIKINRKERKLDLSIRRYEKNQEKELLKRYSSESGRPTLGEATGWNS